MKLKAELVSTGFVICMQKPHSTECTVSVQMALQSFSSLCHTVSNTVSERLKRNLSLICDNMFLLTALHLPCNKKAYPRTHTQGTTRGKSLAFQVVLPFRTWIPIFKIIHTMVFPTTMHGCESWAVTRRNCIHFKCAVGKNTVDTVEHQKDV